MADRAGVATGQTGASIAGGSIPVSGTHSCSQGSFGLLHLPRVIHRVWIDGSPDPTARSVAHGERWAELNPGWEVREWTSPDFTMINRRFYDAPPSHDQLRFKADLLRLEILFLHGGVYVDYDIEPLRPIEPILTGVKAAAAYSPSRWKGRPILSNAVMAAAPGHIWLHRCVHFMGRSIAAYSGQFLAMMSGPHHINRCLRTEDGVTILPTPVIYPTYNSEVEEAVTFHEWSNRGKLKKDDLP